MMIIMSKRGTKEVKIFQTPVSKKIFELNIIKFFPCYFALTFVVLITFSNY